MLRSDHKVPNKQGAPIECSDFESAVLMNWIECKGGKNGHSVVRNAISCVLCIVGCALEKL